MSTRILVVDADADTRALYARSFAAAGWDVVEAVDGREALTHAFVHPPQLVVTELRLPFVDGYALCEILRRDRTTADVAILIVTTEARPIEIERARRAGADRVFTKPTMPEVLLGEIERLRARYARSQSSTPSVHGGVAAQPAGSSMSTARPDYHRREPLAHAHARYMTTSPHATPPMLKCPSCDRPLTYEQSHIGGVSVRHPEQWDGYVCPTCAIEFEYRHRTRKLRRV